MVKNQQVRNLTVFSLVMMTIVSVDSVRNLPATALFGSSLLFFFTFAAICFLIPCAMVSAELASTEDGEGGIYDWVKQAMGTQFGFIAIWFQWIENVIWYPALLSFVAGSVGYLFSPTLAHNPIYLIAVILTAFWGATLINLYGIKAQAQFSNFCAFVGLILPMSLIAGLGAVWYFSGATLEIVLTPQAIMPNFQQSGLWVSLTGIMLSFCGMEIATVHARDVVNPQQAFPKAMLISVVIIVASLMLGSLAIAFVIPAHDLSLVAGIMQAFEAFFTAYHMQWLLPVMAVSLVIGGLGSVSNWIIAPTKGLLIAGRDGNLPPQLNTVNRYGAPNRLLIAQAVIVTLLSSAFLFMPSINGSYWFLTALAAQLYMLMYMLMFAAVIISRYKFPNKKRLYRIPGGKLGLWTVASVGFMASLMTFIIGFLPPAGIDVGSRVIYNIFLLSGLIVMSLPPLIVYQYRKPHWEVVPQASQALESALPQS